MEPVNDFGRHWLGGAKYENSRRLYGASWTVSIERALNYHGRTLSHCQDLHDVVREFRGREFWVSDGFYGMHDTVKPPDHLLAEGGDDCDGWAMTHCQAINTALTPKGWRARIVSYLADPWWMSHHFTLAKAPEGKFWAVQPQPTAAQWAEKGEANQTVFGPFRSPEEALGSISMQYQARVVWHDLRDGLWQPAGF